MQLILFRSPPLLANAEKEWISSLFPITNSIKGHTEHSKAENAQESNGKNANADIKIEWSSSVNSSIV